MDGTATPTRLTTQSIKMTRLAIIVPAVAALWVGAHAIGVLGPLADITFPLLSATTIACILIGVRINRPPIRWPWYLIASGLVLFLIGGAARVGLHTLGNLTYSPSAASSASRARVSRIAIARSTRCSTPRSPHSRLSRSVGCSW
jgi:hypothetical protein